ncbi:OmpA family protein [Candidatus Kapabacteria bacterium]|nr:OmpA family protein [Candidatus Kapabacteria bacterium]
MNCKAYIIFLLMIPLMWSCNTGIIEYVDQFEKQIDSLKNNQRKYVIGRKSYSKLSNNYVDSLKKTPRSSIASKSNQASKENIIDFKIQKIDSGHYPDSISLYISISDQSGNNITDLGEPYLLKQDLKKYWIELQDNCINKSFNSNDFSVQEIRFDSSPKTAVNYVLDYSASMPDKVIELLRASIKKMIFHTKKNDEIGLTLFSTEFSKEIPLTDNLELAKSIIVADSNNFQREGTFIKEPVFSVIDDLIKSDSKNKTIVLFTDGIFDELTCDSIIGKAIRNNVTIHTLAFMLQPNNTQNLKNMAEKTGGRSYLLWSEKEIPYVFAEIYLDLNNYYKITYKPVACDGIHNVSVKATLPEIGVDDLIAKGDYSIPIFKNPEKTQLINLDINFSTNSAIIEQDSYLILNQFALQLEAYPEFNILITGHTDDIGDEIFNLKLSKKRAAAVKSYFVKIGIKPNRIKTEGLGESSHLVDNSSEKNRRINRRTEIRIIKN